jgi:hypothetical protein
MMGLKLSLRKIAQHETTGMFGASSQQLLHAVSGGAQKMVGRISLTVGDEEGACHIP